MDHLCSSVVCSLGKIAMLSFVMTPAKIATAITMKSPTFHRAGGRLLSQLLPNKRRISYAWMIKPNAFHPSKNNSTKNRNSLA